jgi:hypothetical protein
MQFDIGISFVDYYGNESYQTNVQGNSAEIVANKLLGDRTFSDKVRGVPGSKRDALKNQIIGFLNNSNQRTLEFLNPNHGKVDLKLEKRSQEEDPTLPGGKKKKARKYTQRRKRNGSSKIRRHKTRRVF